MVLSISADGAVQIAVGSQAQGLVVDVEHPTLGTIRLPGPPLLDQDAEAIRAWVQTP